MLSMYQVISFEFYTINYINCNYNDWASLQVVLNISWKKYINWMSPLKKKTICMGSFILCDWYLNKAFLKEKDRSENSTLNCLGTFVTDQLARYKCVYFFTQTLHSLDCYSFAVYLEIREVPTLPFFLFRGYCCFSRFFAFPYKF